MNYGSGAQTDRQTNTIFSVAERWQYICSRCCCSILSWMQFVRQEEDQIIMNNPVNPVLFFRATLLLSKRVKMKYVQFVQRQEQHIVGQVNVVSAEWMKAVHCLVSPCQATSRLNSLCYSNKCNMKWFSAWAWCSSWLLKTRPCCLFHCCLSPSVILVVR